MKRLSFYDFDGTLFNTPEPIQGKEIWSKKMGRPYPHIGWWGRSESLDINIFDIKPISKILNLFNRDIANPDTMVIILTSRLEKLRPQVQNILDVNNVKPDKLIMKNDNKDKGDVILEEIKKFTDLEEVNIYDDFAGGDENKIIECTKIKNKIPSNIQYNIYYVNNGKISLLETNNILLQIINNEIRNIIK